MSYYSTHGAYADAQYQRDKQPLQKGYKYGRQHSWECTCGDCLKSLEAHLRANQGAPCFCQACQETRNRLQLIADTEERGRQSQQLKWKVPVAGINICDRIECGSMGKSNIMGNASIYLGGNDAESLQGQLCPACVAELVTWWEGAVGDRQRAYTKAWTRPSASDFPDMTSTQLMQLAIEKGREELNQGEK